MTQPPVSWVVGAGGLLGSAVVRELARRGEPVLTTGVPWEDGAASVRTLDEFARALLVRDEPWRIVWCAGAGVVGSGQKDLDQEVDVIGRFLARLSARLDDIDGGRQGSLFLASSAGGVHAGSVDPPFTETTAPAPISPYGEAKLATENIVRNFAESTGTNVMIGRIANLYGPGQDIAKAQGLISQLCKSHLTRQPISIYVSLDTARDYLYVDDCARIVLDGLNLVELHGGPRLKILASQQATTIASILAELRRVTKRRPQVILAANPLSKFQAKDLRFQSTVMTELDRHVSTTLATGIRSTLESLAQDMRAGRMAMR